MTKQANELTALAKRQVVGVAALAKRHDAVTGQLSLMQRQLDGMRASLTKIEANDRRYRCMPPLTGTLQ